MATVRSGDHPVLLVVDVQRGVVASAHERDAVLRAIGLAVDKARAAAVPVLWVQHADEELVSGSEAWELVPELQPRVGEGRLEKHHNSSFEGTDLESRLAALGATRIVLAGAATNWCIRATAYAALERGYDLSLVSDAHTTESLEPAPGRKIEAKDLIEDLNTAMSWLSYPGRKNEAVRAAELSFA